MSRLHDAVHRLERGAGVTGGEGVDHGVEQLGVRVPQQRDGALITDGVVLRTGDELVEQRQGVSRRTATRAHDERQHAGFDGDALLLAQAGDVFEHRRGRHQPERVVVGARADGAEHLVGFGRGEDELHVRRGFFHELQQRVEALLRDHVGLVEDEDLEPVAGGCEHRALAQIAGVVDAVVAGRVDLDHIERTAARTGEFDAAVTDAARGVRGALSAVQAARQDAGGRGLATAARTREQIGVAHAVAAQRGHERIGHLGLTDHLREGLGTVAAIEGCGHPFSLLGVTDIGGRAADAARPPQIAGSGGVTPPTVRR